MESNDDVRRFVLGPVQTNCYLVDVRWLIDPGGWDSELRTALADAGGPEAILLTHAHYDHIGGIEEVREQFGPVPIFCHRKDQPMLGDPEKNLSSWSGQPVSFEAEACVMELSKNFETGIPEVIELPGHTPGSVGFYWGASGDFYSGDSLFKQGIGRTDLPGGDQQQLLRSIRQSVLTRPDDTTVWPGHGPATTVAEERTSNPFLQ